MSEITTTTGRQDAMPVPGTRITGEETREREIDGVKVTETTIHWNDTSGVSVDYTAHVLAGEEVDMYADRDELTSFDEPLNDDALRALMVDYRVLAPV
jgi:hypothetical protein